MDQNNKFKIKNEDLKPLFVGVALLIVAGFIGYSLGVRSVDNAMLNSEETTLSSELQPTVNLSRRDNVDTEVINSVPDSWPVYDKIFGISKFTFRYPNGFVVSDSDPASGQLYIFPEDNFSFPAAVVMDTLNRTFYFEQYSSGPVKDWFLGNIKVVYPDTDFSQLKIDRFKLPSGKSYLTISNWPESIVQINPNLFTGRWYVYVDKDLAYYIVDNQQMEDENFKILLSSVLVDPLN